MPDERVQAAIRNWAPRFISQGVDYNDFVRTTGRIGEWKDWCREWCVTGDLHRALALQAENSGRRESAGEAYIAAALCYHFGRFLFQDYPDEYSLASSRAVSAYGCGLRLLDPTAERVEIPLDGARMVGTLRRPPGARQPALVMLLPGLDSTKEEFFHWEAVFLKRGLATLSLDGPGQGECGFQLHLRPDYEAAVCASLDHLAKRDDVDHARIGVAGVSLGGYYAARAAAYEARVKAAVANCGPWDFGECWDGLPGLTRAAFRHHSGARDDQDAKSRAAQLTLDGAAQRIRQPLLIIHGGQDRVIPCEQARRIASAAAHAELVIFENGNHVCNNLPYLYRPLTADWLREKLG